MFRIDGRRGKGKRNGGKGLFFCNLVGKNGGKGKEIKSTGPIIFNPPKLDGNDEKGFGNYNFSY